MDAYKDRMTAPIGIKLVDPPLRDKMVRYRAKHRLTQRDLADKAGVTVQTICNIETGQQTPSRVTEQKILLAIEEEV